MGKSDARKHIPPHDHYACRYWVDHVIRSDITDHDGSEVYFFLQRNFLHWLEALSLIGKVSDSVQMMTHLQSLVVSSLWDYPPRSDTNINAFVRPVTFICTKCSMMQGDSFSITDQLLKRRLSKSIALLLSLRQR